MGKRLGLVAACIALSCGGPQRGATKAEPPLEVKTYGPLGIKADAKAAHQAVLLGTDVKDGSTILPSRQSTGRRPA